MWSKLLLCLYVLLVFDRHYCYSRVYGLKYLSIASHSLSKVAWRQTAQVGLYSHQHEISHKNCHEFIDITPEQGHDSVELAVNTEGSMRSDRDRNSYTMEMDKAMLNNGLASSYAVLTTILFPQLVFATSSLSVTIEDTMPSLSVIVLAKPIIDTLLTVLSVLFLCRVVLSWYPKTNLNTFPFNIIAWPTEALAAPVRGLIPPAFGVDISSLVWLGLLSFIKEILTGQQGILTLLEKNAESGF